MIKMLAGGYSVENTDLRGERPDAMPNDQNGIRAEKYGEQTEGQKPGIAAKM